MTYDPANGSLPADESCFGALAIGKQNREGRKARPARKIGEADIIARLVENGSAIGFHHFEIGLHAHGVLRWEVGEPGMPLVWDARCKTLLGLSADAAVTYPIWVNLVHPDDRAEAESVIARALDPFDSDDGLICKYRIWGADGSVVWLLTTGRAYFEPDPAHPAGRRPLRLLGAIRDITETELDDLKRHSREKRGRRQQRTKAKTCSGNCSATGCIGLRQQSYGQAEDLISWARTAPTGAAAIRGTNESGDIWPRIFRHGLAFPLRNPPKCSARSNSSRRMPSAGYILRTKKSDGRK